METERELLELSLSSAEEKNRRLEKLTRKGGQCKMRH